MARNIGIVGAGIAGLHLALYLQKHGVDATSLPIARRTITGTSGSSTPSRITM